jgi:PKD repeat protein
MYIEDFSKSFKCVVVQFLIAEGEGLNSKLRQSTLLLFIALLLMFALSVFPVGATPCAILKVSLLDGVYHGYDVDPWLCESYLLNLTGASQTFTVRINNTSSSLRSYDTRLVIALNNASYNNLVSLIVNGTSVPKSAFKWGTPKPYKLWTWPSGDVYPTWFNDTCINVDTIPKKGFVSLIVSVTFSDANGVRMHFDAYGKSTSIMPTWDGQITHNPPSEDSTVLLQPGVPPAQPPIASFTFNPTYPEVNQVVNFDASGSYDPDGYIVSYKWDFGDGTPPVVENNPITYHTYTSFGDYIVKLTVTDNSSLTDDETAEIHVSQHPVASFTFSPPDPLIHEIVTFDASASTPDGGTIVSYQWDFGDGNVTSISDPIITHAYATYGTYTITLNVTDSEGKWDTESKQITVEKAPIADFTWSPYYPQRGETVTFDALASTPDGGTIVNYVWDFGDGTPIVEENDPITTHAYTATGDYMVTLNVTDSEGRLDTETKIITVVPIRYYLEVKTEPPSVTAIPGENWYNEGMEVTLTAPDAVPVSTGIRYKFSYWDVNGTPKVGNPITVFMDANHTATAHYILEYYLTVSSPFGTAGGEGWYQNGTTAYATLNTGIIDHGNGTRRVFTNWSGDASGTNYAQSNPIVMNAPKAAIANWKTQYLLTVVTDPAGLSPQPTRNPVGETGPANSWWYDASTSVTLTAQTVIDYTFNHWDLNGTSQGSGMNPIVVVMNAPYTATAHYTYTPPPPPPPLSVSISPPSASVRVGQSVNFFSTVSGGTAPYNYQWYLNDTAVSGAISDSWVFTPTASGTYMVYLKVTDKNGNTAQSDPATVKVSLAIPVGGYSISLARKTSNIQLTVYATLIALFGLVLVAIRRKRK